MRKSKINGGGFSSLPARSLATVLTAKPIASILICVGLLSALETRGQITNVVFTDNWATGLIDPLKFQPDAPVFEGGTGNISAAVTNGEVEFTGSVSVQWWAGATLRIVPTFTASQDAAVVASVDRVAEAGVGSSSRSALWIMDSTLSKFVLFADNRGEDHWEYNRKINEAGDTPTGGGTAIAAFDAAGSAFLDEGLHRMKAVADGKTVRLYLDDVFGAEVKFPYTNLVFQIGSYARANTDTADTTFSNLVVQTVGAAIFSTEALTLSSGQTASGITVKIPNGANAASAVQIRVVSSNPAVAAPVGATNGTLTLTFAAGGTNVQSFAVQGTNVGGAQLTLADSIGLTAGNSLAVTVISGPGVQLQEDFSANIDTNKWQVDGLPFETGVGTFTLASTNGALEISGTLDQSQYWGGTALKTVKSFIATTDLELSVEVDRVSVDPTSSDGATPSTGARTGIFLANADRSKFLFFGQDFGETGWEVNLNPGNPTGSGTAVAAFASMNDTNSHHIKLQANGSGVSVYLDGIFGGTFNFPVSSGIYVELGAYSRALSDAIDGKFAHVKVENTLPCVTVTPAIFSTTAGDASGTVSVTIPRLLNGGAPATVTVTSSQPTVAIPLGAVNGILTLNFPIGATNVQTFKVQALAVGTAAFTLTASQGDCVANGVDVTITAAQVTLFSDAFNSGIIDTNAWVLDFMPLVDGVASVDSSITVSNQAAYVSVTASQANWPGLGLATTRTFSAGASSPLTFEIDRVKLGYVLVTGTGAKQRSGIWVTDSIRSNYVFFSEYATHDGTAGGWQYHRSIGAAGDTPVTGAGVAITAFAPAQFNDQLNHHMKAVANGATVKLYLDGVFGAEVPFPFAQGIVFEFGDYVAAATDQVTGIFDNARVTGSSSSPTLGPLSIARNVGGNFVVTWTGTGILQSATTLGGSQSWSDVSPAPTGNSFTNAAASAGTTKFFRLRQ